MVLISVFNNSKPSPHDVHPAVHISLHTINTSSQVLKVSKRPLHHLKNLLLLSCVLICVFYEHFFPDLVETC